MRPQERIARRRRPTINGQAKDGRRYNLSLRRPPRLNDEEEYFVNVKVTSRRSGDVNILDVAGKISLGEGTNALRNGLNDAMATSHKIVLNLAELTFIDSSGLREVLGAYQTLSKNGGQLKLLSPAQRVRDLLRITKLNSLLEVYDDEAAALGSFR